MYEKITYVDSNNPIKHIILKNRSCLHILLYIRCFHHSLQQSLDIFIGSFSRGIIIKRSIYLLKRLSFVGLLLILTCGRIIKPLFCRRLLRPLWRNRVVFCRLSLLLCFARGLKRNRWNWRWIRYGLVL